MQGRFEQAPIRGRIVIPVVLTVIASTSVRAQTDAIDRDELRCQTRATAVISRAAVRTAACVHRCVNRARRGLIPPEDCAAPYAGRTRACIDVARERAAHVIEAVCSDRCPSCYTGGDCVSFADSELAAMGARTDALLEQTLCETGGASPSGRTEQRCEAVVTRILTRLAARQLRCRAVCHWREHRGRIPAGSCGDPPSDLRTERCLSRAAERSATRIERACSAPRGAMPECHSGTDAATWVGRAEAVVDASHPQLLCTNEPPEPPADTLRDAAAERGILIGALDGHAPFPEYADPVHEAVVERELAITSTFVDMRVLHPAPDTFDFGAYLDGIVDRNEAGGTEMLLTPLVYHDFVLPDWIVDGSWTAETLSAVLRNWIHTVVGRYRGRVHGWVVVNEPLSWDAPPALFDNIWRRVIGDDYIEQAFRWAREADPDARLYLNETNIESTDPSDANGSWMAPRADFFHSLVADLVARGTPIDGIGFQMHTNLAEGGPHALPRDPADLAVQMQRYADLGLEIAFTEWDVAIDRAPGTLEERLAEQARVYGDLTATCVAQPACRIIHIWGVSDAVAEYSGFSGVPPEEARPVLFDLDYEPKPAYFAVREALRDP